MYLTTVLSLIVLVAATECIPLNQVETQRNTRWTLRSIFSNEFCQNYQWLFNNLGLYRCNRTCDFIRMSQVCDNARDCGFGDDEVGCITLNDERKTTGMKNANEVKFQDILGKLLRARLQQSLEE